MSARVGIVIRTKDRPVFLTRALADVARQSFADWEVVIVNDGGDRAEVDRVVADSGIAARVLVTDVGGPGGRCAAANVGIRLLATELVVLHDDDDLWEPEFLAQTTRWLEANPDAGGVVASTSIVYEQWNGSEWIETARFPFWDGMTRLSLDEMLRINRAVPISFLYRRALHEQLGFYDETLDAVEDWEFLLRVLPRAEVGYLPGAPLALWMQRPDVVGADANSMFGLRDEHRAADALVRDRELARWVRDNGAGLPLYLASLEQRLVHRLDEGLASQRDHLRAEIDAHQPILSRLRRLRRRMRDRRPRRSD